jgi:microcystin-dependent protein
MDPFVSEIRIMPTTFPPKAWAECNGQLLPLSQNTALFSLLGTIYGGDGKSTFALPDLVGRAAMHPNYNGGGGLSQHSQGEIGGSEFVTLLQSEIPAHTHFLRASNDPSVTNTPNATTVSRPFGRGNNLFDTTTTAIVSMNPVSASPAGGNQPHNNMQPYLTLRFCIALQGVYPPRP